MTTDILWAIYTRSRTGHKVFSSVIAGPTIRTASEREVHWTLNYDATDTRKSNRYS